MNEIRGKTQIFQDDTERFVKPQCDAEDVRMTTT